jgi:hypothetical protein
MGDAMKKLILIIAILCISTSALAVEPIDFSKSYALSTAIQAVVSAGGAAAGCGGGTSYLLCENFDGSSACGDGSHTNCDNEWVHFGAGTMDFNYATSPAPLEGSYSARMAAGENDGYYHAFTASDTVYFYFIFNPVTRGTSNQFFAITAADDTNLMYVTNSGYELSTYCGTVLGYEANMVQGTTLHIWGDYTRDSDGGAASAVCHLYSSTTSTKPGSPTITTTNGTGTAQAARVRFYQSSGAGDTIWDKIRVSTSDIGSTPN